MVMTGFGLGWINIAADWSRYQRRDASGAAIVGWNTFGGALAPVLLVIFGLAARRLSDRTLLDGIARRPDRHPGHAAADVVPRALPARRDPRAGQRRGARHLLLRPDPALARRAASRGPQAALVDGVILTLGTIYVVFFAESFIGPFQSFLITLGVPLAAWAGIMIADIALRKRDYDDEALFDAAGRYGAFDWVSIGTMVVASVIGWGLVVNSFADGRRVEQLAGLPAGAARPRHLRRRPGRRLLGRQLALRQPRRAARPGARLRRDVRRPPRHGRAPGGVGSGALRPLWHGGGHESYRRRRRQRADRPPAAPAARRRGATPRSPWCARSPTAPTSRRRAPRSACSTSSRHDAGGFAAAFEGCARRGVRRRWRPRRRHRAQAHRRPRGLAQVDRGRPAGRDQPLRPGLGDQRRRAGPRRHRARSGGRTSRRSATPTRPCATAGWTGRSCGPGRLTDDEATGLVELGPEWPGPRSRAPTSPRCSPRSSTSAGIGAQWNLGLRRHPGRGRGRATRQLTHRTTEQGLQDRQRQRHRGRATPQPRRVDHGVASPTRGAMTAATPQQVPYAAR